MREALAAWRDYILAGLGMALFIALELISTRRDQRRRSSREQLRGAEDGRRRRRDPL